MPKNFIYEIDHSKDNGGFADDNVFNTLNCKLHDAGYIEVTNVAADVYEGRIAVYAAASKMIQRMRSRQMVSGRETGDTPRFLPGEALYAPEMFGEAPNRALSVGE